MADGGGNQKVLTGSQSGAIKRNPASSKGAHLLPIDEEEVVLRLHEEQVDHLEALGDEEDDDEDLEGHPRADHVHAVERAGDGHEEEEFVLSLVEDHPPRTDEVQEEEEDGGESTRNLEDHIRKATR